MTTDSFGHPINFGVRVFVGKVRKDGKYPVKFVFCSTGGRVSKLFTLAQLHADLRDMTARGTEFGLVGYVPPDVTP